MNRHPRKKAILTVPLRTFASRLGGIARSSIGCFLSRRISTIGSRDQREPGEDLAFLN